MVVLEKVNETVLMTSVAYKWYLFFFQAEDGIRDVAVTGVQTCALPILGVSLRTMWTGPSLVVTTASRRPSLSMSPTRSEERRVGKECRYRWATGHEKKKRIEESGPVIREPNIRTPWNAQSDPEVNCAAQ